VYGAAGRVADELRAYERAYAVDPLAPIVLVNYAIISRARGHRRQSERLVHELAALDPDSAVLYRARSTLALEDGRIDESIRWLAAGAKRDPEDASMYDLSALGYSWLGDVERGLSQVARLNELTPGSAWGVSLELFLHLVAGDLEAAGKLIQDAKGRYETDPAVQRARATYLMARGEHSAALEALLVATPWLREPSPTIGYGPVFWDAPMAAYLYRETGDVAQSRRLAQAFARAVNTYHKPVEGPEQGAWLWVRAQMAAVTGDRAAVIYNLTQLHDQGGILPAFVPKEPWFQAYRDDPAVVALFAKAEARREEARRQLRAEGL
jgi:predicted Zn-dependent protease